MFVIDLFLCSTCVDAPLPFVHLTLPLVLPTTERVGRTLRRGISVVLLLIAMARLNRAQTLHQTNDQ